MREILFRAKRIDNKEWVEGFYFEGFTGIPYILTMHDHILGMTEYYEVDPATVGQFTGLHDKNSNQIFEGDVLRNQGCWDVRIEFENGVFWVRDAETVRYANKVCNVPISEFFISNFEIISNIHDEVEP